MANTGIAESSNLADITSDKTQAAVDAYFIDKYNGFSVVAFAQCSGFF